MLFNQPKGLIPAALSNMGERFGYYIMNAVLVLFLCSKFGLSEEAGGLIYSIFYAGIYVLSLVGGFISDKTQNYKGTIISGLVVMSLGYALLSIPILATSGNHSWLLAMTCIALFLIAFGNGLFTGRRGSCNSKEQARYRFPDFLRIHQYRRPCGSVRSSTAPFMVAQGKRHDIQCSAA